MDNMDFNKYWNNRIYTDEERLELAKELFSDNSYNIGVLSIIAKRLKNIEERLEEEAE